MYNAATMSFTRYQKHPAMLYSLFLLLAVLWSASFLAIKVSIGFFSPILAATLRVGIAFIALSILFISMKASLHLPLRTAKLLWIQGIIAQGLAFVFLFWGEQYIAPALASIINAMVPLWVLLINGLILRERNTFTIKKTMGLILGFTGIVIIFAPLLLIDNTMGNMAIIGALSVTGMAISYAVGAILYQKLLTKNSTSSSKATPIEPIDFKASIWHQHLASFVFLLLMTVCTNKYPNTSIFSATAYDAWIAVIYLGLFSTAFAWIIYSHLIVQWGAVRAVSVLYIVPIFAIIWDLLFLHISMSLYEFIGIAAILSGVLCVQTQKV